MKFSANLSFMFQEEESLVARYRAAAAAGFSAVEVAHPYTEHTDTLVKVLQETGLKQVLINTAPGTNFGHGGRAGEEAEFRSSLATSLHYCGQLGAGLLHIMAGRQQEGVARHEALSIFQSNLESVLPDLEKAGVVGLIEPINPWSLPRYNMDSFEDGLNLVKSINHPNIKLQLDLFHLQQVDGNLTRNIEAMLPYVGHIQIAQVPSRGEPDSPGEVDYSYVLGLLERLGYSGHIGLEYTPVEDTVSGLAWVRGMGLQDKL